MFSFKTEGEVVGMAEARENKGTYVRIRPTAGFTFTRQGEMPAPLSILVPAKLAQGLPMNCMVSIEGVGAVGTHEWTKKEFGTVKSKDIQNYYFNATKLEIKK